MQSLINCSSLLCKFGYNGIFCELDLHVDNRGLHVDQKTDTTLHCQDSAAASSKCGFGKQRLASLQRLDSNNQLETSLQPAACPIHTFVRTDLPLTSPGLVCCRKHLKFARLIQQPCTF